MTIMLTTHRRAVVARLALACVAATSLAGWRGVAAHAVQTTALQAAQAPSPTPTQAVYLVYYWRARPGKTAAYAEYIRTVAEPIDEAARRAGVFEDVHTYTPALATGAPGADWTHMRVFKLKSFASWDAFSAGLDEAAVRVFPDDAKRRALMAPAAELRDLVRQEIWRDFR